MLTLSINWSNALIVTGLGIMIVFVVLVLLIFLLTLSGKFFTRKSKVKDDVAVLNTSVSEGGAFTENEKAAIAMALYLYYEVHDEESYVITINEPDEHSSWNSRIHGAHEF